MRRWHAQCFRPVCPTRDTAITMSNPTAQRPAPIATFAALSGVAGFVDAACFLALSKVFTAHVTGNFAALASALLKPDGTAWLRVTVIVAFAFGIVSAVGTARVVARTRLADAAPAATRYIVVGVEAAWLVVLLAVHALPIGDPWARLSIAWFAGGAMGCQSALSKLPGRLGIGGRTTVMTTNFTEWTIAAIERNPHDRALTQLSWQLLFFLAGAAAGAIGESRFGVVALVAPLAVLVILAFTRAFR